MGINPVDSVFIKNDGFDSKRPETHFFSGWHGLTCIDSVNSVLTENDSFDPKSPETYYLPWSTWLDLYWLSGIGSYGKDTVDSRKIFFWILNFFLIFLDFYK